MFRAAVGASNMFCLAYVLIILLEKKFLYPDFEALGQGYDTIKILHAF